MQIIRESLPGHPDARALCERVGKLRGSFAAADARENYETREYCYKRDHTMIQGCGATPMHYFVEVIRNCSEHRTLRASAVDCRRALKIVMQRAPKYAIELMLRFNQNVPQWTKERDGKLWDWMGTIDDWFIAPFAPHPLSAEELAKVKLPWLQALKIVGEYGSSFAAWIVHASKLFKGEKLLSNEH